MCITSPWLRQIRQRLNTRLFVIQGTVYVKTYIKQAYTLTSHGQLVCWMACLAWQVPQSLLYIIMDYHLTKTVQNGGAQSISEILHIENLIVCCIKTYIIPIYLLRKCNEASISKDFYVKCVFWHKWVIPKYHNISCLNELTVCLFSVEVSCHFLL